MTGFVLFKSKRALFESFLVILEPYDYVEETEQSYNYTKHILASKHLSEVEIKCREINEKVDKVLNILSSYGVLVDQINIKENICPSESKLDYHFLVFTF